MRVVVTGQVGLDKKPFLAAVGEAARYGLYDLDRLERMILRRVARDYFLLEETETDGDD